MKEKGWLLPYVSPEAKTIPRSLVDRDNYYCGARIVTLGFVYNSRKVSREDVPADWRDLLKPRFKDRIAMADPRLSGTALYTVAGLQQNSRYGWPFLELLRANGMRLENSAESVVENVAKGRYNVGIGVDYIVKTMAEEGAPLGFVYPKSGIPMVASPIAILKSTKTLDAAKKLYDYILSIEGQLILMQENVIPVRPELKLEGAISINEAVKKTLSVNDQKLVLEKEKMLSRLHQIMAN